MGQHFDRIQPEHRSFIEAQHVFFVATAAAKGRVNLSPKGQDCLRLLDDRKVVYLDLTGSGNETAAHIKADGRLTLMFCAFDGPPKILRVYGRGKVLPRSGPEYRRVLADQFKGVERIGARQMILLEVERTQTSCGYAVPHLAFRGERRGLDNWAKEKGSAGLAAYRSEHNSVSIDGAPTGFSE